ncbi:MAG: hypothetical protein ACRESZ_13740 [Methylococcales bacterium]
MTDKALHLTDADLQPLNAERVSKPTSAEKEDWSLRRLEDRKEARERLNAHSGNSSRPPSGDPPRDSGGDRCSPGEPADHRTLPAVRGADREPDQTWTVADRAAAGVSKRAGRPKGATGRSRAMVSPVTETVQHARSIGAVCGAAWEGSAVRAETGW